MEPMGFEPTVSSMPSRRAPNCATAPPRAITGSGFYTTWNTQRQTKLPRIAQNRRLRAQSGQRYHDRIRAAVPGAPSLCLPLQIGATISWGPLASLSSSLTKRERATRQRRQPSLRKLIPPVSLRSRTRSDK